MPSPFDKFSDDLLTQILLFLKPSKSEQESLSRVAKQWKKVVNSDFFQRENNKVLVRKTLEEFIKDLNALPYYYGNITREDAEKHLKVYHQENIMLLRNTTNLKNTIVLSYCRNQSHSLNIPPKDMSLNPLYLAYRDKPETLPKISIDFTKETYKPSPLEIQRFPFSRNYSSSIPKQLVLEHVAFEVILGNKGHHLLCHDKNPKHSFTSLIELDFHFRKYFTPLLREEVRNTKVGSAEMVSCDHSHPLIP